MFLINKNAHFHSVAELEKMDNDRLIEALFHVRYVRELADSEFRDGDGQPLVELYTPEDKNQLYEQEEMVLEEIYDRLEDDAKLKRLNSLNRDMGHIKESLKALKKAGLNTEVMVYWIANKSSLGITDTREFLKMQDDFFNKMFS